MLEPQDWRELRTDGLTEKTVFHWRKSDYRGREDCVSSTSDCRYMEYRIVSRKGIPLLRDALALPPRIVRRAPCHQIVDLDPDVTKLPIPKCWPKDGGRYITLPLVVTRDPVSREHNMGMYRGQVHSEKEIGLHWQIHKHGADHASMHPNGMMPVAICIGGPPELIFSAISPLPDNLEEYMFAGFLGRKRLKLTRARTQDLLVPAEADIVIEGWTDPNETKIEGPFGDHYGFYSLPGNYPRWECQCIPQ